MLQANTNPNRTPWHIGAKNSNVYNMNGRVVFDMQTTYETKTRKHSCSSKMVKIPTILVEKITQNLHEKQCNTITSGCITFTTTD